MLRSPKLALLVATFALVSCNNTTDDGGSSDKTNVSFSVPLRFAGAGGVAAQVESNSDVDRLEAKITLKSTGEVVLQKTLTEGSPEVQGGDDDTVDPVVTLSFRVPPGAENETFTLVIDGFLGTQRNIAIGPADFLLTGGHSAVTVQATYVGPGASVTGVAITPRSITVQQNQVATFACAGTPGNVAVFPYEVSSANEQIMNVTSLTSLHGNTVGTTQLICRLGFGSHAEDRVNVTVTPLVQQPGGITGIIQSNTGTPIFGATVELRAGTGVTTGTPLATATAGTSGGFTFSGLQPGPYTVRATAQFFVDNSANVTVVSNQNQNVTITLASNGVVPGSVQGTVRNAVTSALISGAVVEIRSGSNVITGPTAAPVFTTSSSGQFTFANLAPGAYTIRTSATGFTTDSRNVTVVSAQTTQLGISLVTPGSGVRITLDWGPTPPDLDAHLFLPDNTHIYFGNLGNCAIVCLDADSQTGFGPETMTIAQQVAGDYFFYVHNFSNCLGSGTQLATSGATVKVFFNGVLQQTIPVPNQAGVQWTVFKLNGTTITPVNIMTTSPPSGVSCFSAPAGAGATKK